MSICSVQEYDRIFVNKKGIPANAKEDNSNIFVNLEIYNSLRKNIGEIADFLTVGFKNGIGGYVCARNYVGVLQLPDGFKLEILPKACVNMPQGNRKRDKKKREELFEKLRHLVLAMLRSFHDFSNKIYGIAGLNTANLNLFEVFIRMYLDGVMGVVKRGFKSAYVPQEGNLSCLKGKLLFNEHLRHNLVHQERFYVVYDEYSLNRPEHRLIKAALWRLRRETRDSGNENLLRQLLAVFDEIEPSKNYAQDFASIIIDRQNREYEEVLNWTRIFLRDKTFTPFAGANKAQALLFPAEKLFEAYVGKQISQIMEDWDVSLQAREKYLFTYNDPEAGQQKEKNAFLLKPDILLKRGNRIVVMDAKWKVLENEKKRNWGISQEDMYHMYAYAHKYIGNVDGNVNVEKEVYLLYPKQSWMDQEAWMQPKQMPMVEYRSEKDKIVVKVFVIDLLDEPDGRNASIERLKVLLDEDGGQLS